MYANNNLKYRLTVTTKAICCISACCFLQLLFFPQHTMLVLPAYSITALTLLACFLPIFSSLWICLYPYRISKMENFSRVDSISALSPLLRIPSDHFSKAVNAKLAVTFDTSV